VWSLGGDAPGVDFVWIGCHEKQRQPLFYHVLPLLVFWLRKPIQEKLDVFVLWFLFQNLQQVVCLSKETSKRSQSDPNRVAFADDVGCVHIRSRSIEMF
jgi:hypothetical protein